MSSADEEPSTGLHPRPGQNIQPEMRYWNVLVCFSKIVLKMRKKFLKNDCFKAILLICVSVYVRIYCFKKEKKNISLINTT